MSQEQREKLLSRETKASTISQKSAQGTAAHICNQHLGDDAGGLRIWVQSEILSQNTKRGGGVKGRGREGGKEGGKEREREISQTMAFLIADKLESSHYSE